MPNKELDKIEKEIVTIERGIIKHYEDCGINCPKCKLCREKADQILSLKTSNGYSIQEMIEFFGKIKRDTQREAVVDREAKPPHCPVVMEEGLRPEIAEFRQYTINQYYLTQELMCKAGWVKEVKDA